MAKWMIGWMGLLWCWGAAAQPFAQDWASVALPDPTASLGRFPAALSDIGQPVWMAVHTVPYGLAEAGSSGSWLAFPLAGSVWAVGMERQGFAHYRSLQASGAWARRIGPAALGIRANWHQTAAAGYETRQAGTVDAGTHFQLSERLYIGAYFENVAQHEGHPSSVAMGASHRLSERLWWQGAVQKPAWGPVSLASSVAYAPGWLRFQLAYASAPSRIGMGVGMGRKRWTALVAWQHHYWLGTSGGLRLWWQLGKR